MNSSLKQWSFWLKTCTVNRTAFSGIVFVFVIWLLRDEKKIGKSIYTVYVSVSTVLRFVKLPHLFIQQTSHIFKSASVKLIHFMHWCASIWFWALKYISRNCSWLTWAVERWMSMNSCPFPFWFSGFHGRCWSDDVFWVLSQCRIVGGHWCFRGTYINLQGSLSFAKVYAERKVELDVFQEGTISFIWGNTALPVPL